MGVESLSDFISYLLCLYRLRGSESWIANPNIMLRHSSSERIAPDHLFSCLVSRFVPIQ